MLTILQVPKSPSSINSPPPPPPKSPRHDTHSSANFDDLDDLAHTQTPTKRYPVQSGLFSPRKVPKFMLTILQAPKTPSSTTSPPPPPPKSPRHDTHSFINFEDLDDLTKAISPRTSFSFSMTNPDYNGNDDSSTTRKFRIGDIPMSSLTLPKPGTKEFAPLTVDFYAPPKPTNPPARTWHP
jgi:hypothetical protein